MEFYISESDVSLDYREVNVILYAHLPFLYRSMKNNVNISVYGKTLKCSLQIYSYIPRQLIMGMLEILTIKFSCCIVEYYLAPLLGLLLKL
jgi:hypothetical protein